MSKHSKANPQNSGGHHDDDQNRRTITGDINVVGKVDANLPPDLVKEYINSSQGTEARENSRFRIEKITLVFVIAVAVFTLIQVWLAVRTMQWSRRPWVGVEDNVVFDQEHISWVGEQGQAIVQNMARENKLPIRVLYPIKNSGYGPALNTMLVIKPIMFSQTEGVDDSQIRKAIEESCKIAEQRISMNNGDLLLPGGEHTVPYTFGAWDSTKFLFTPGCIVYRDIDGGFHHTKICYAVALFVSPTPKGLESCQEQSAN